MIGNFVFSSFGAKTVLIFCDNKRRDAASNFLLAAYLKDLGYNSVIGSRLTAKSLYYAFKPDLVLLTHPDSLLNSSEMKIASKDTIFFHMHPESAGMSRQSMMDHMRGGASSVGDAYTKHISKVFTWGSQLAEWLVEEGIYHSSKIQSVGCPRYDFYINKTEGSKTTLGMMSSFTGITTFDKRNPFRTIDLGRKDPGVHFSASGGIEDFFWTSAAFARIYLEFLDIWCFDLKNEINFRSYTLENIKDMAYFPKKYDPYLHMDHKTPFSTWLGNLGGNIYCYSSSVIESFISKVPYICAQGIIEDRLEWHQPKNELGDLRGEIYDYTHQPRSVEEMVGMALKVKNGSLTSRIAPENSRALSEILSKYYGYPNKLPSTKYLALEVDNFLKVKRANNKSISYAGIVEALKAIRRTILHIAPSKFELLDDYHLMPWDFAHKNYAFQYYDELKKNGYGL